ncbi:hypothetical protein, partial [Micromonospora sp. NPDC051296]|uniref:hypothetical protein n=1 Tax=Micromonospora sp. NPDC051296 TaxID=3155046 RepID=UPI00342C484F
GHQPPGRLGGREAHLVQGGQNLNAQLVRIPTRWAAALLRRAIESALLLAAADPTAPPLTRALLLDGRPTPGPEPVSRGQGAL